MTVPTGSPDQPPRRLKARLFALAGALLLVTVAGGAALYLSSEGGLEGGATDRRAEGPKDPFGLAMRPRIPQARWDVDVDPIRIPDTKLSRTQRRRVAERRSGLTALVRDVYDAMFFDRSRLRAQVRGRFTPATAEAILHPQFGFPAAADQVQTFRRSATIAVEAGRGAEATAEVTVNARASIGPKPLRVLHRATLWLLREQGRWRVVALEADQEPIR